MLKVFFKGGTLESKSKTETAIAAQHTPCVALPNRLANAPAPRERITASKNKYPNTITVSAMAADKGTIMPKKHQPFLLESFWKRKITAYATSATAAFTMSVAGA